MKLSILVPLSALLSFTAADFPDVDLSQCLTMCLSVGAAVAGCSSYVDSPCTCPSEAFKNAVGACLKEACICTPEDIETAGSLHKQVCEPYE